MSDFKPMTPEAVQEDLDACTKLEFYWDAIPVGAYIRALRTIQHERARADERTTMSDFKPMTDKDVQDALALCEKATKGPWESDDTHCRTAINTRSKHIAMVNYGGGVSMEEHAANADFISTARTDYPRALRTIQHERARADALEARLKVVSEWLECNRPDYPPMTAADWERLKELSQTPDGADSHEWSVLFYRTENEDEHPDGYDGPCMCQTCVSYAEDDPYGHA